MDFAASMAELKISVPIVAKDEQVAIPKSGSFSGLAYLGLRWDSLAPQIVKQFLGGGSGSVDLDTMAVVLNENYQGVLGSLENSCITFKTLRNSQLGMCRSKDDRDGNDSPVEKALDSLGKEIEIDGRMADDERAYIDLDVARQKGAKYILITADLYAPHGAEFSTLKLKSAAKDGEAWLRIADASTLKQSVIDKYGNEPPTLCGNDIALVDLDELGAAKGAIIGFFKLNNDDTWSWITKVEKYECNNGETYQKVFAMFKQAPKEIWDQFFN
jgi:hypothetical protein